MRQFFLLFTLAIFSINCIAQQVGFDWAEKAFIHSSSAKLQGRTILVDPNDNVYLFGVHASSNNANFKNNDMILAKFNSLGKRLWYKKFASKTFPGHGSFKMYWDKDFNLVVAGEMNTIFGTDTLQKYNSALNATIGIVKFDSTGEYIWSTQVDADVDDEFDFVQLANGNYAIRGTGAATYKPDTTVSSRNNDFVAFISSSGKVTNAIEADYNKFGSSNGLGSNTPRRIFSTGKNLASVIAATVSNSPLPGVTSYIVFNEFEWSTGTNIKETRIKYDGFGVFDYQFDSVSRILYLIGGTNGTSISLNDKTTNTESGSEIIIQYSIDGDSVVSYQKFENIVQISFTKFSYENGLTVVYNYRDSCKNTTLDSSYYELPNVASGFEGQNQYLIVNFNENLDYHYYAQYGTSNGSLFLFDLTHNDDGNLYGCTDGSSESYFGELKQGTLGNSDPAGFIFKVGDTSSGQTAYVRKVERSTSFKLYPNPATSEINIQLQESHTASTIAVNDINGRSVINLPFQNSIFIDTLEPGVYFLKISNKRQEVIGIKRFMKE